jgi:hypothetical protein
LLLVVRRDARKPHRVSARGDELDEEENAEDLDMVRLVKIMERKCH